MMSNSSKYKQSNSSHNMWDKKSLDLRIDPSEKYKRFAGASPDEQEIQAYKEATLSIHNRSTALVLGMTPEVRKTAIHLFESIISVDSNPQSILTYTNWLTSSERRREQILNINWFEIKENLNKKVQAIYGDGVFANLSDIHSQRQLLQLLSEILDENGKLIVRKAVIPNNYDRSIDNFDQYLANFRRGCFDDTELGFSTRVLGFLDRFYNQENYLLNVKKIFDTISVLHQESKITDEEFAAIERYYFAGSNCILPEKEWENLLVESGFNFKPFNCFGKEWYRYFKIYQCYKKN